MMSERWGREREGEGGGKERRGERRQERESGKETERERKSEFVRTTSNIRNHD